MFENECGDKKRRVDSMVIKGGKGGKGDKGLGKGSTMRHRLPEKNMKIGKPAIKRLARRAGVKRMAEDVIEKVRSSMDDFLVKIIRDSLLIMKHNKRKTVTLKDLTFALENQGQKLY